MPKEALIKIRVRTVATWCREFFTYAWLQPWIAHGRDVGEGAVAWEQRRLQVVFSRQRGRLGHLYKASQAHPIERIKREWPAAGLDEAVVPAAIARNTHEKGDPL